MRGKKMIIEGIKSKSPLIELIKSGVEQDKIKEMVIETFTPYFENKDKLIKYSSDYLIPDWVNIIKYLSDTWFSDRLYECLTVYRTAKVNNSVACFGILKELIDSEIESGNRFWSFLILEINKKELELFEYTQTVMSDIGKLIEGLSKLNLIEFLSIVRLSRGKIVDVNDIRKLDLGVIVNELIQTTHTPALFQIKNIKLSDWRNIAYHHDYSVDKENICCKYGPKDNRKSITLNRTELWAVLEYSTKVLDVLNLAHKIFFYDNESKILRDFDPTSIKGKGRAEIWFLTFATAISAQGFEVIDFQSSPEESKLIVKELRKNVDFKKRAIHSSQFVYNLWYYTSSKNLIVEYLLPNELTYLISSSTSDICEKIGNGSENLSYLAEHIKLDIKETVFEASSEMAATSDNSEFPKAKNI